MDWMDILKQIFEVCIIPLLGVLTVYLVKFISAKKEELKEKTESELADKYIEMLAQTICECVNATNQTYVEALKDKDAFDIEAQKEAFNRTYNAVMQILTEEAKDYLTNIYGDLNTYVTNKIEAEVRTFKNF